MQLGLCSARWSVLLTQLARLLALARMIPVRDRGAGEPVGVDLRAGASLASFEQMDASLQDL